MDPTEAVLPNVTVTLTNDATGATQTTTTSASGIYHFGLLQPASYTVSVAAPGFQAAETKTNVDLGQSVTADITLKVKTSVSTVQVTENGQAVQVENGDISTTFNTHLRRPRPLASVPSLKLTTLPNPGNNVTSYAQTAPGVTMNTQGGYGNFSSFGLPAASNLFTLDGQNDNDPYLNLKRRHESVAGLERNS